MDWVVPIDGWMGTLFIHGSSIRITLKKYPVLPRNRAFNTNYNNNVKLSRHRAPVAQLVEYRAVMREVAGSNPGRINT